MPQLMLEFFSEEIPARMQARAQVDLGQQLGQLLRDYGLEAQELKTFSTPRRLIVVAEEVPLTQAEVREEKRGPRVDAPAAAIEGFLTSVNLPREACEVRETPKGAFLFATLIKPAQETISVLPRLIDTLIKNFPWPKSMHWGTGSLTWVRPLHSILCLYNGVPVDLGLTTPSTRTTLGHRFLSPKPIIAENFQVYQEGLLRSHVIIDPVIRREKILEQLNRQVKNNLLSLRPDERLLDEVTGLVEWPHVLMGKIDEAFMALPEEVLITVMRHHQRYFATIDGQGNLAPYFLTVANITPSDQGETAIRGNEWVLRARLADAAFFWQEDLKTPLEEHGQGLSRLIFHTKLGSMAEKVERLTKLALELNKTLQLSTRENLIHEAAQLAKADLTTQLVTELPELQGQVGFRLSEAQQKDPAVTQAIRGHYAPQGSEQPVPKDALSILIGLADRLDTLAGFFLIGEKPTGSKDPYALRRAALGIVRTVLDNQLTNFQLEKALKAALEGYPSHLTQQADQTLSELTAFLTDRLRVFFRDQGFRHDVVEACLLHVNSPIRLAHFIKGLQTLIQDAQLPALLQTFKRACNILRQAKEEISPASQEKLLEKDEEKQVFAYVKTAHPQIQNLLSAQALPDLSQLFSILVSIRPHLDAFFDAVTVNVEQQPVRANRYALLNEVRLLFAQALDFSLLEG